MGAHKTGTTTLQADLALNRSILQGVGLVYPDFHNVDSHYRWAGFLAGEIPQINAAHHAEVTSEWLDNLQPDQALLLSAESFYRYVNTQPDYLVKLKSVLKDADITPVLCLRSQADFAKSLYSEWVSNWQYPHDIYRFINDFYSWFDFESVVAKISQLGKPILMSYHQIAGANLSKNFISQLGYHPELAASQDRLRVTPSDAEVHLKRLFNKKFLEMKFRNVVSTEVKKVVSENYPQLKIPMPKLIWHGMLDPVTFERSYKFSNMRLCQQFNFDVEAFFPKTKCVAGQLISAEQASLLELAYHEVLQAITIKLGNLGSTTA